MLSSWGSWSECTKTCGGGQRNRTRSVDTVGRAGGKPCEGGLVEIGACGTDTCDTDIDCSWREWQEWSACSRSCGVGSRVRSRMIAQAPRGQGKLCEPLDMAEVGMCDLGLCHEAKDCVFEPWTPWGDCSATCHGVLASCQYLDRDRFLPLLYLFNHPCVLSDIIVALGR